MITNFDEKPKKSQLEIHMSFTYNKSYSLYLHVTYIIGKICYFQKLFILSKN